MTIAIPNAGICSVRIDETTTLGDLLPRIARTHRYGDPGPVSRTMCATETLSAV